MKVLKYIIIIIVIVIITSVRLFEAIKLYIIISIKTKKAFHK